MWEKIFDYGRQLVTVLQRLQKHDEDIEALQQRDSDLHKEMSELRKDFTHLTRFVERLSYEIQRSNDRAEADRSGAESDRRILLLEIENRFLRHERGLPPAEAPKPGAE